MRRREFIAGLGGAVAWPMVSRAQQRTKVPRLGVLLFSNPVTDPNFEVVRGGLRELGYIQGQNVVIFYRYAEGEPERLADIGG
jgi:putative ABC transport system substrate-binding protein